MSVDDLIIEFAEALKHANEGAWGTWPTILDYDGVRCTPQMARLHNAEHALLCLSGRADFPETFAAFTAATADRGCPACWLSSNKETNHPERQVKMRRYFDERSAVAEYAERLLAVRCT